MADKFCSNCGTSNPETAKFCVSCGTPAAAAVPPPAEQPMPPVEQPAQFMGQPMQPTQPIERPASQQQPYPGYPPQPQPFQNQPYPMAPTPAAKPKKKGKGVLIGCGSALAFVVLIAVIIVVAASSALRKAANADYYNIKNDQVPSVKYVLGEKRKVTGTGTEIKNGVTNTYWQYDSSTPEQDIDTYFNSLAENEGWTPVYDGDMEFAGVGRNSVTPGYQLEVQAEHTDDGYIISVYYLQGQLEMLKTPGAGADDLEDDPYNDSYVPFSSYVPPETTTASVGNDANFSADADYYYFGNDRVPSVKQILGYRDVSSSARFAMGGETHLQAEYKSETPNQDAYNYLVHLMENDGFISLAEVSFTAPSGRAEFGRNSVDTGYIIILTLDFDSAGYKIEAQYKEGKVTLND